MMYLPLSLLLVPLLCFAVEEKDFDISVTAQGTMGYRKNFESIGSGKIYSADTLLQDKGGYDKLYQRFVRDEPNQISTGIWQKAESFNDYLKKCQIDIPTETIALKMGLDSIFAARSQTEVDNIAEEVGSHLSFERKITFISQVGAALNVSYDYSREDAGVVSMMDMVDAKRNGTKAGVCRDMHYAMAQLMVKMGVPNTFVIGTQIVGGGHAVVIAQDPNDPLKTYMVNYGNTQTQTSASSSSHLLLNGLIPSIGVAYRIYNADGKAVANLPTGMGMILNDFLGNDASKLDPLQKSESSFGSVALARGNNALLSISHGVSSDNDVVTAISAKFKTDSEHFPTEISLSLYNMKRDTAQRGELNANGAYITGVQNIRFTPIENLKVGSGSASVEVYGRLGMTSNYTLASLSENGNMATRFSGDRDVISAAGTNVKFQSNDGKTKAIITVEARGSYDKFDVRDESVNKFDLRDITGTATLEREISRGVNGYFKGTVVSRNTGLGAQAREEIGVRVVDSNGATKSLTVGHEGQVSGPVLAFLPGSIEKYNVEVSFADKKNNAIAGGVYCSTTSKKDCGSRVTGKIKLPLGWDHF